MESNDERSALINRAIGLSHLRQIAAVRGDLQAWLRAHPDDAGIRELETQLARQEAASSWQSAGTFAYLTTSGRNVVVPVRSDSPAGEGGPAREA